jgi:hypothetical protein
VHSGVSPYYPSSRYVSQRVNSHGVRLALAVAAGLLAACSRPDGDILYRPFGGPGQLEDGLPDPGEVLVDGVPLPDAGLGPDAQGPLGDVAQDPVPDAGGGSASLPDAAVGADAGVSPDAGGDAGASPIGDAGTSAPLGYWAFDAASELASFQFTDSGIVSAQEWHAADQHAATGHLVLTAPFTSGGDSVDMSVTPQSPLDLAGHVLKIRIQRLSGTRNGGVRAFAESGSGPTRILGVDHTFSSLDTLTDISFDFAAATAPDQIVRYGIYVHSGGGGGDGTQVLMIDSLGIE